MQLAGDFPAVTHEQWLEAVAKVLKGRDLEVLRSQTLDGITVEPLYTADDAGPVAQAPAEGVGRRSGGVAGLTAGWDVRQRHGLGDPTATNQAVLSDLARGVTSIELATDGVDAAALDAVLADVLLDLAPISLMSPTSGLAEAQLLLALAASRGVAPGEQRFDLGCDPIAKLAAHGSVELPVDDAIAAVAALANDIASTHPHTRVFRADGGVHAEAGASPAAELGATVATAVAYLRALTDAGVDTAAAFRQVLLSVSVGTDQFGDIAKLRALRVMWARVADVAGVPEAPCTVQATTASNVATLLDPWVNMLRVTIGCFAAAVGGADIIQVRPFDDVAGAPDDLGLRIARNTQLTLMEESNIHRVIDPAGGSWYVEQLTDQLAAAGWDAFRALEAEGGIVSALRSGAHQERIATTAATTQEAVATRARPITGISEFPDIDEDLLERAEPMRVAVERAPAECTPLEPRRHASGFEVLRMVARGADVEPTIFLANLGPVAVHTARAGWAKNFFEAGGIRTLGNDGFDDAEELAAAFAASGARFAVLCSSDDVYADRVGDAAPALRNAGAERIYLAGHPRDRRDAHEAAGVDEFVHVGTNVLASLQNAHRLLGLGQEDPS